MSIYMWQFHGNSSCCRLIIMLIFFLHLVHAYYTLQPPSRETVAVEQTGRCAAVLLSNQELCGDFVAYNFHFLIRLESRKLCERLHIMSRLRFTRLRCTFATNVHGVKRRIACAQLRCLYDVCNLLFMCINRIVKLHQIQVKVLGGQEM